MSGPFCLIGDGIVHSRTKARCPPINGIAERFHKTVLDELYRIAFRKKFHAIVDRMQSDYGARTRQSRWFYGKTPLPALALLISRRQDSCMRHVRPDRVAMPVSSLQRHAST